MARMLYGRDAVLARARLLSDFKWTPVSDISTWLKDEGNGVLPAGVEVTGFPYSSLEAADNL